MGWKYLAILGYSGKNEIHAMAFQGHDYGVASNVRNTTSPKQQLLFEDAKYIGEKMKSSGTELHEVSCGFSVCFCGPAPGCTGCHHSSLALGM